MAILDLRSKQDKLFDLVWDLWDNGESRAEECKRNYDYWKGKLGTSHYTAFDDQKKTCSNIVKEIIETKVTNTLDAKFTLAVAPVLNSFADYKSIKDMHMVADVYDDCLKDVLRSNNFDSFKERSLRWGEICGHGAGQTLWSDEDKVEGEIKLTDIEPVNLRWNKGAKKREDINFIAYLSEQNPSKVKGKYAVNPDGSWNQDLCDKIDEVTETQSEIVKGQKKGVVAIKSNEAADLAYAYESQGINSGKMCKLIIMFLLDDTVYAPDKKDDAQTKTDKETYKQMYPNGRMIVFIENKDKKIILEDKPAPEGFKNLGNIDIFNPIDFEDLWGINEVDDLIPIQDRINGAWIRVRKLLASYINAIALDKGQDIEIEDNDLIDNPVIFLEGIGREKANVPGNIKNDTLLEIKEVMGYIEALRQEAYKVARLNETITSGVKQTGVNSAEQEEVLQESPMSSIRSIQRNFKDYIVHIGDKILTLIQENYTVQRMIKLSSNMTIDNKKASVAMISKDDAGARTLKLIDELGETVKEIKINPDWKFGVEVTAGTEIARSRKENAALNDDLVARGAIDLLDLDQLELYLRDKDVPNYRALMKLKREKMEQMKPEYPLAQNVLNNKELAQGVASLIKAVSDAGHNEAVSAMLVGMGLSGNPNTLATAPIDKVTSRSDVKDVATIAPEKISNDPEMAHVQNVAATKLQVLHNMP
mgnify:CR=1 FL=1